MPRVRSARRVRDRRATPREDLDGDVASQPGVARAIHLAHAADAEQVLDLEHSEATAGQRRRHRRGCRLRPGIRRSALHGGISRPSITRHRGDAGPDVSSSKSAPQRVQVTGDSAFVALIVGL